MSTGKTPLAVFTYNRPDHAGLVLNALSKCRRLDECQLYIYCDGARIPEHGAAIEASRRVVREVAPRLNAQVIERTENIGNARSIVDETTRLCEQYGRVIVLEDDLVVSPDFVNYMLEALDRYQDEPSVYQISGYMYPIQHEAKPDAFFLPLATAWGWATWHRAWKIFDWKPAGVTEKLEDTGIRRRFDLDGSYPYTALLEQTLEHGNDVWDILWWWAVFDVGGVVLHPRQSLVWNAGFDGSGTHCGDTSNFIQSSLETVTGFRFSDTMTLPDEVSIDHAAFDKLKSFVKRQQSAGKQSLSRRLQRKLRSIVSGSQL